MDWNTLTWWQWVLVVAFGIGGAKGLFAWSTEFYAVFFKKKVDDRIQTREDLNQAFLFLKETNQILRDDRSRLSALADELDKGLREYKSLAEEEGERRKAAENEAKRAQAECDRVRTELDEVQRHLEENQRQLKEYERKSQAN